MSEQLPSSRLSAGTRGVLAGAALLLPTLTLVPFGGMYLWEHGLLLWWALFVLVCVAALTAALKWLLGAPERGPVPSTGTLDQQADAYWSAEERKAWDDVLAIAAKVDPDRMTGLESFVELGQQTLDSVARTLHPEKSDPLWQFTLPEALAIVERVSRRLGGFVVDSVPFGDRLTVAQIMAAYRWRGMFGVAERAYDVWRIVRLVNPATAVTNEARERLTRAVFNYGKEHVARRIAEAFVEEVGRAAIDLYGGRLAVAQRLSSTQPDDDPLRALSTRPVALNVSIGGGSRTDRLALASLLADAAARAKLTADTATEAVATTIGQPLALRTAAEDTIDAVEELNDADIVIWIVTGAEHDRRTLAALAASIHARGDGAIPVLVPVLLARNCARPQSSVHVLAEAAALASALDTIATELIELPSLDLSHSGKLESLVANVQSRLTTARRVHIQRALGVARRPSGWAYSAKQALRAAGALSRAVVRRGKN